MNKLWYTKPASCFEEALPIGNGSLGAMVYGGVCRDRLSLNHDTLWSGTPGHTVKPEAYEAYRKARQLIESGDADKAEDLVCRNMNADWSQNYLPMGNLYLESPIQDDKVQDCKKYSRVLDMQNAVVKVTFERQGTKSFREYFASNPDDVIVLRYYDEMPQKYTIFMDSQLKSTLEYGKDFIKLKGECPSNLSPGDRTCTNPCTYDGKGIRFTTMVKIKTDGIVRGSEQGIIVENSTEMYLYLTTQTSYIRYDTLPKAPTAAACESKNHAAQKKGYERIYRDHKADFSGYYNRAIIDLGCHCEMPTDEFIRSGENYAVLADLVFNYAKYLLISASRPGSQAMTLQGIWNEAFQPPWCCSYTLNINTEMNYWVALPLNLPEMQQPYLELAQKLADTGKAVAKETYHSDGYVSHHVTDLWGMPTVCGPGMERNASWGFFNLSSAWLLNELFQKYKYTGDIRYLENDLYPMMKEAVKFYKSQLADRNGKKVMLLSTSPENRYVSEGTDQAIAPYTAMTQELLIVLFQNYVTCCEILQVDSALKKEIEKILPQLDTFDVGKDGRLLEWDREYEEKDVHHRHVSHLYGIYPGGLFTERRNPKMYDASRKSLEMRGDDGTGWSIAWKINLWARLKDGNRSFELFKKQKWYPNLLDVHPPFQIDGNFGAAMGIIQWFVQCEDNTIKILPALPDEILQGKLSGIAAEGNITLSIEWKQEKYVKLSAISPVSRQVMFEINGVVQKMELVSNETVWYTAICS